MPAAKYQVAVGLIVRVHRNCQALSVRRRLHRPWNSTPQDDLPMLGNEAAVAILAIKDLAATGKVQESPAMKRAPATRNQYD
jgi:hypothetical protein